MLAKNAFALIKQYREKQGSGKPEGCVHGGSLVVGYPWIVDIVPTPAIFSTGLHMEVAVGDDFLCRDFENSTLSAAF